VDVEGSALGALVFDVLAVVSAGAVGAGVVLVTEGLAFGVMATGVVGSISVLLQPVAAMTNGTRNARRRLFMTNLLRL
jgi:hypothetical protein